MKRRILSLSVLGLATVLGCSVNPVTQRPDVVLVSDEQEGAARDDLQRRRGRMVTLMVDPSQAESLQLAMTYGQLRLALRNPLDKTAAGSDGVLMSDLSDEIAKRIAAVSEIEARQQPMMLPAAIAAAAAGQQPAGAPDAMDINFRVQR